jgi:hypothetical protein
MNTSDKKEETGASQVVEPSSPSIEEEQPVTPKTEEVYVFSTGETIVLSNTEESDICQTEDNGKEGNREHIKTEEATGSGGEEKTDTDEKGNEENEEIEKGIETVDKPAGNNTEETPEFGTGVGKEAILGEEEDNQKEDGGSKNIVGKKRKSNSIDNDPCCECPGDSELKVVASLG